MPRDPGPSKMPTEREDILVSLFVRVGKASIKAAWNPNQPHSQTRKMRPGVGFTPLPLLLTAEPPLPTAQSWQ